MKTPVIKTMSILGSTGSIGTQALDVVRTFPQKFKVKALTAGKNVSLLKDQILEFNPEIVAISGSEHAKALSKFCQKHGIKTEVVYGKSGVETVAKLAVDFCLVAIVGTASILPTYEAIQAGATIGLACKEVLVSAGSIITAHAAKHGVAILPVDSEHAALKQCMQGVNTSQHVARMTLTASGGPFWNRPVEALDRVTPKEALKHPNWDMGAKISIDSATMMNKGLEIIEAHHLFNMSYDKLSAVIHPQSVIHSIVEFIDGNMVAHLGPPDMRYPIQYAMSYPEKWHCPWPKASLAQWGTLSFYEPDDAKFPLLKCAYEAGIAGGSLPVILNAANEAAVHLFLEGHIRFTDIAKIVQSAMSKHQHNTLTSIHDIVMLDTAVKEDIKCPFHHTPTS